MSDCLLEKRWVNGCREAALPGDVLCAFHAAYFRRRCPCGTRLADRRGVERRGGLCYRCYERTPEYQARRTRPTRRPPGRAGLKANHAAPTMGRSRRLTGVSYHFGDAVDRSYLRSLVALRDLIEHGRSPLL